MDSLGTSEWQGFLVKLQRTVEAADWWVRVRRKGKRLQGPIDLPATGVVRCKEDAMVEAKTEI